MKRTLNVIALMAVLIGSKHENEGFGKPYDLPNLTNYTEICAAVSYSMWNTRMFLLNPHAKYFDVLELTLYNNLLAGVSLEGNSYFYPCAMESDGKYKFNLGFNLPGKNLPYSEPKATRKEWFPCACCPPTLVRYIPQIPGYIYAAKNDSLFVNLFINSKSEIEIRGQKITLELITDYPWNGKVVLKTTMQKPMEINILIRVPGWVTNQPVPSDVYRFAEKSNDSPKLLINNQETKISKVNGYASIKRKWSSGDEVVLDLPMTVRKVLANELIEENKGKTAILCGPVLYCFEAVDNNNMAKLAISEETKFTRNYNAGLMGGSWTVNVETGNTQFMAIPYYKWSNRGENEMKVWVPLATN